MSISGRRIHVAGSASKGADGQLLAAAHSMIGDAVSLIVDAGGGLVAGTGDEPIGESGQACTFDWTILERLAEAPDPAPNWPGRAEARFRLVASQRALEKIPESRRDVWEKIRERSDFELETAPAGWRMGGMIRTMQVRRGDVLVALSGGGGTEQLAELYVEDGKPVIPVHCDLGAIVDDGKGGSIYLHGRALSDVDGFFAIRDGVGGAAARLSALRLTATSDPRVVATALVALLEDLRPPIAFYARLLNRDSDSFDAVERFFRNVVDRVVLETGFTPHEVGRDPPQAAFLNVEIFETLHKAGLVVVDLTDVRPNCTMELGYAFGRGRRVMISAKKGTRLPFDPDKLPTYFWDEEGTLEDHVKRYQEWFEHHLDMPPVAK